MRMSDNAVLIDSNILVYAFDSAEPEKQKIAKEVLKRCWREELHGVVALQNLGEFFNIITKKVPRPLAIEDAEQIIEDIIAAPQWEKVSYDAHILQHAMVVVRVNNQFWDAVLLSTMIANNINTIYTENAKDFNIKGIKAVNPFS